MGGPRPPQTPRTMLAAGDADPVEIASYGLRIRTTTTRVRAFW